jgi:hypothetical protein
LSSGIGKGWSCMSTAVRFHCFGRRRFLPDFAVRPLTEEAIYVFGLLLQASTSGESGRLDHQTGHATRRNRGCDD